MLCKKPNCNKPGNKSLKGYCYSHYEKLDKKSELFLKEMKDYEKE